jgi:hypothetical protein
VFNFKASPVYSTWQASDIPNHVTHQPSQADLCCGDCACLFQALTERRVNGGFVRFQAIRSRCAWSTLDIRSAGAFKKALARREESRDRADTIGTGQPAPPGRVPRDHPSPQAPAARVEPQLEMTHIAKNTTDMHAPPGSSRACRHRMVRRLEPELTSTSSAGLGSNAYHPRYHHRSMDQQSVARPQGLDAKISNFSAAPRRAGRRAGCLEGCLRREPGQGLGIRIGPFPHFWSKKCIGLADLVLIVAGQAGHEWVKQIIG